MGNRVKRIERKTKETDISVELNIDGSGKSQVNTGIGFMDHMLASFMAHGRFDGVIVAKGDIHIDYHHTVEDTGIVLGLAFNGALSDKKGIKRFGSSILPMDESLVLVSVDISGRPYLVFDCSFPTEKVGNLDTELFVEFFRALVFNAGITLHVKLLHGSNSHHIAEAIFKGTAIALKEACSIEQGTDWVPSTKGII